MKRKIVLLFLILQFLSYSYAQVEHVSVSHPVYSFLLHAETMGFLQHFSLSCLPLQRQEIIDALKTIEKHKTQLNEFEINTLNKYLVEFEILPRTNAVVFYSSTDSNEVLSLRFFSNDEKFLYHYKDSSKCVNISPLGSFEAIVSKNDSGKKNVVFGNLGVRIFGSLNDMFGYYLQATNGTILKGDSLLALHEVHKLQQNVKFTDYHSDFDFTETHVRFQDDWFYAIIGRETRLLGAGLNQRLFISDNAAPFDAISLGAKFSNFEYRFTHGSLLSIPIGTADVGVSAELLPKFVVIHRFSIKPSWGEIAYWESIIYSRRGIDLGYLNPLVFLKSIEHALRDRDNSFMGGDLTLRPLDGFQIKGSYLLDDLIFSKIGTGYWSNKDAWNIALICSLPYAIDLGVEYSRVEPYTFTHFDSLNVMANDRINFGSYLLPNSDELAMNLYWYRGDRYPVTLKLSYQRHGANYIDSTGKLVNVGGDIFQTLRPGDSEIVKFLDGKRINTVNLYLEMAWEIIRGFSLHGIYHLSSINGYIDHSIRFIFRFEDF
jgi:hypothetical protein